MLEKIRLYFHCALALIAGYLGISEYTLKSISAQRRNYNLTQLNKLLVLYQALFLDTPIPNLNYAKMYISEEQVRQAGNLETHIKKTLKKLQKCIEQLTQLQTTRHNLLRGYHACTYLLNDASIPENDKSWLKDRKIHLELLLEENSNLKELVLKSEIAALEKKIEILQLEVLSN